MYCSTCGSLINTELNYCNRCGARVDKLATREKSPAAIYLSMATGFVGLGGLGLTVGLIAILLKNGVIPAAVVILGLAFLLTVFGMTFMMLRQISQLSNAAPPRKEEASETPQLNAPRAQQLEEPRQPARSVTENTTRTLEKELMK
jgi:hypothetical protein